MRLRTESVFALLVFAALPAAAAVNLGTAANYSVLGGSTVTNTGSTIVTGNVGVSPGSAITGFPPGVIVGGSKHSNDASAIAAQSDMNLAFNAIGSTPCGVDLTGQDLGGLTLTPGVYCFSSSAGLTGQLTLNALGNPNAEFIFKIGSTLTTASASNVVLTNGASSCNVYWRVGSSATLGTTTNFSGNILASASITLTTGANASGKLLAHTGGVTLDTNNVGSCTTAPVPPGGATGGPSVPSSSTAALVLLASALAAIAIFALRR